MKDTKWNQQLGDINIVLSSVARNSRENEKRRYAARRSEGAYAHF